MNTEKNFDWKLFLFSLFFGIFGVDRFYVGKKGTGILKLLTAGGFFIWWLVDLFLIASGKFTDAAGNKRGHFNVLAMSLIVVVILCYIGLLIWGNNIKSEEEDKISIFAQQPENADSLQYYCLEYKKAHPSSFSTSKISKSCQEVWAPFIAEEREARAIKKAQAKEARAAEAQAKKAEKYTAELSATQLFNEYANNELAADEAYKKKWIKVSGIVESIGKDIDGNPNVILDFVRIHFKDKKELVNLRSGQEITVIGRCEGMQVLTDGTQMMKIIIIEKASLE
jgi:TM2 domain-containing membrane protein YozV